MWHSIPAKNMTGTHYLHFLETTEDISVLTSFPSWVNRSLLLFLNLSAVVFCVVLNCLNCCFYCILDIVLRQVCERLLNDNDNDDDVLLGVCNLLKIIASTAEKDNPDSHYYVHCPIPWE